MIEFRSKLGFAFAVIFFLVNFGGAIYAFGVGEPMHGALHVALLVPGVWLLRRFAPRRVDATAASSVLSHELPDRLTNLEQSLDAVAIEMERIGEGQRAMTNLLVENDALRASADAARPPSEGKPDR